MSRVSRSKKMNGKLRVSKGQAGSCSPGRWPEPVAFSEVLIPNIKVGVAGGPKG